MNKERILKLADHIEKMAYTGPDDAGSGDYPDDFNAETPTFNMAFYMNSCETAGCIAGWAAHLFGKKSDKPIYDHADVAAKVLGLDWNEHGEFTESTPHKLFYPTLCSHNQYTPQEAAQVLRELAETGEVNWPKKFDFNLD